MWARTLLALVMPVCAWGLCLDSTRWLDSTAVLGTPGDLFAYRWECTPGCAITVMEAQVGSFWPYILGLKFLCGDGASSGLIASIATDPLTNVSSAGGFGAVAGSPSGGPFVALGFLPAGASGGYALLGQGDLAAGTGNATCPAPSAFVGATVWYQATSIYALQFDCGVLVATPAPAPPPPAVAAPRGFSSSVVPPVHSVLSMCLLAVLATACASLCI